MKRWRLLSVLAVLVVLIAAAAAYALSTSGPFLPRTEKWATSTCTKSLLNSVPNVEDNEKIALCYSYLKLKEDDTSLTSLQSQVTGLEGSVAGLKTTAGNLEKEVTTLKEEGHGGPPPPEDFIFFTDETTLTSPVFDAKNYTHVVFTSSCGPPGLEVPLKVEVSPDQTHWVTQTTFKCGPGTPPGALPTAGRYYRMTDEEGLALSELFVLGRFSN
jgi:hypothetical protein